MTKAEKLKLIKKHAPIFWLHEYEAFVPEDCKIMVEISDLYRKKRKEPNQPKNLDELGQVPDSQECYLKIIDLDMKNFSIPTAYHQKITGLGPAGVAELAREKYGFNYYRDGFPSENPDLPKYYARVSEASVNYQDGDAFSLYFQDNDPKIFGK
ncbi:MAG: hypothetical protein ACW98D_21885, partial [Promethearchaeota archaeon]